MDTQTPITRRNFLTTVAAAGTALGSRTFPAAQNLDPDTERPNILLIVTDDQRWDAIGCINPILQTPNMDTLVQKGANFQKAFVTTSICAASRASIFSGLVERTHMYTFGRPPMKQQYIDISYPALLRESGYRTGFVGKFGVRVPNGAPKQMFDEFRPLGRNPYFKDQPDGPKRHLTDITGDQAVSFLRSCNNNQPFCLSVSFNAPHAEDSDPRQYIWPRRFDELYKDATIPTPQTANPQFFASQPEFLRKSLNRVRWRWRFDTRDKFQEMVKGYYRMITAVDAVIGRLCAVLDELQFANNTVILLIGDNGYFLGERGFAGKWLPYEDSLRVPLILYDPRNAALLANTKPRQIALNIDVPATILDLAGLDQPKQYQGCSLLPLLTGHIEHWRQDFFFEHLMEHPKIIKHEGVRTEYHKYIRYFQQEPVYEELFDLPSDPDETENLISEPRYAHVLRWMRKRCNQLRDTYGGPYSSLK